MKKQIPRCARNDMFFFALKRHSLFSVWAHWGRSMLRHYKDGGAV
jgi:hypothetical protein